LTIHAVLDAYEKRGETRLPGSSLEEAEKISRYLQEIKETIDKSPVNIQVKDI
jgi:hypothetical protein